MSEYAAGIQTGIELAVADANEVGVPMGSGLELHVADTNGDPETAESELKRLISKEDVVAVVGGLSFPVAQALESQLTGNEVYAMSPTITEAGLSTLARQGQIKFFGRTAQSRGHIGKAFGEVMNSRGGDTAVIAHPDDDPSEEVASMGEDVHDGVANAVAYNPEEENYADAAAEAMSYEPTEVGVVGMPDQALDFVDALVDEGYSGVWVFDEYLRTDEVAAEVSDELESVTAVAPNPEQSPGEGNLDGRFDGETNQYSTYAYDAMAMIAVAMHQGGESEGYEASLNIADIASQTPDASNEVEVAAGVDGLSEAKSAINDRNAVNYRGASGRVNLSIDHNPLDRIGIYELGDGTFSHVSDIPGEEFERSTGGQATG